MKIVAIFMKSQCFFISASFRLATSRASPAFSISSITVCFWTVLPLTRMSSGRLGVDAAGGRSSNYFAVSVDARGSTNPSATSEMVKRAVDEALSARIPGIIQTSAQIAHRKTVDNWQRRGSRFE